jgi:50S ribosomal protein L16 3-hydroxylase
MIAWPTGLDPATFLERYWQKSPLMLPGALPDFSTPITPEELAGLACEPDVEARLVTGNEATGWSLRHGPFSEDDFLGLPDSDWTLLVQDVEKHLPGLESLMSLVSFIPQWRCDDLMISYAAAGGSVGPHLDAYDVFLIQGMGQRTWSIDRSPGDERWRDDCELRVLREFAAEETFDLATGDVLYLPPGVAHYGVARAPSMTLSVGFRAPTASGLLSQVARALDGDHEIFYADPDLSPGEVCGGRISAEALDRARGLFARACASAADNMAEHLGRLVTQVKPWLEPLPPEREMTADQAASLLHEGARIRRHPGSRFAWCSDRDGVWLFCDGEAWVLPREAAGFCDAVCVATEATMQQLSPPTPECVALLCELVMRGSLQLPDRESV